MTIETIKSHADMRELYNAKNDDELVAFFYEDNDAGARLELEEQGFRIWLPVGYRRGDAHAWRLVADVHRNYPISKERLDRTLEWMGSIIESIRDSGGYETLEDLHEVTELALSLDGLEPGRPIGTLKDRIAHAVEQGELAFWREIAKRFPEVKTGDWPPDAAHHLTTNLEGAVSSWYRLNTPDDWSHV